MRVAVIPARGGSRRIPRKNIRPFHGKPIIAYSIEAAKKSRLFQAIYVSTEDANVADVALDYGAIVIRRPWRLANDEVGTQEVMRDVLNGMSYDVACCIYATCPMLTASDLVNGYNVLRVTDDYAYVPGWFYWGASEWFGVKPLGEPAPIVVASARYIDINTPEDWAQAEEMYVSMQNSEMLNARGAM
jgi:pseudaminic acid cytidylyltransferase